MLWFAVPLLLLGTPMINGLIPLRNYFSATPSGEGHLKIMTYNVHVFGLYNWRQKDITKNEMFRYIETEDPDIACFQEYFYDSGGFFPTTDSLLKILKAKYYYQVFSAHSAKTQKFGIATFSKYPIIAKGSIRFEKTHNLCIYTDILYEKDTLRVYNCHLQSLYFNDKNYRELENFDSSDIPKGNVGQYRNIVGKILLAAQRRSSQVKILRQHIDSCQYSIIVCGDFNDNPFSYAYRIVSKGFKDSFSGAGSGFGYTWEQKGVKQRIDYVLYSKDLVCSEHKITRVPYSDHYPLVVKIGKK